MPIYEFHCAECKRDSEVLVRSSRWKGTACPHCGSKRLEKQLSVFASSGAGGDEAPTCGMGGGRKHSGGCGCCCGGGGGRHRH